jgi:hypothetical protein
MSKYAQKFLVGLIAGVLAWCAVPVSAATAEAGVTVSGMVTDSSGQPVSGLKVYSGYIAGGGGSPVVATDSTGRFSLPVAPGSTRLIFDRGVGTSASSLLRVMSNSFEVQSSTDLGTLHLPEIVTKTVRVHDANGVPVTGATLYIGTTDSDMQGFAWAATGQVLSSTLGCPDESVTIPLTVTP